MLCPGLFRTTIKKREKREKRERKEREEREENEERGEHRFLSGSERANFEIRGLQKYPNKKKHRAMRELISTIEGGALRVEDF